MLDSLSVLNSVMDFQSAMETFAEAWVAANVGTQVTILVIFSCLYNSETIFNLLFNTNTNAFLSFLSKINELYIAIVHFTRTPKYLVFFVF